MSSLASCSACGARLASLLVCTGCGDARYCDAACQRAHWKVHRGACKKKQCAVDQHDDEVASEMQKYELARGSCALPQQASHAKEADDSLRELESATRSSASLQDIFRVVGSLQARLCRVTCHPAVIAAVVRGGGAALLIAIMDSFNSCDPSLRIRCGVALEACCNILGHLASPYNGAGDPTRQHVNSECCETIAAAGGAATVVAAMRDHCALEAVAANGCGVLCNISLHSMQAASVISAGGLLAVAAALRMHWASVHAPVANFAVRALMCMLIKVKQCGEISLIAPRIKEAIDDGCIPVLLAVLRSRRKDPILQESVPIIMRLFAVSSPENLTAVVAAGGGEYVAEPASAVAVLESDVRSTGGSRGGVSQAGPSRA